MDKLQVKLIQDRRGMNWDLLLYIPTVAALFSMAAKFWYGEQHELAYLLVFLGSFFTIAGINRIFKTRLMLLPNAPVLIEIGKSVNLTMKNGGTVELIKDVRFFSDYAGKSFGLAGMDGKGARLQFVFHKGQFSSSDEYKAIQDRLRGLSVS